MLTEFLLVLILLSIWVSFYQILKQQGRILLRLDALEKQPHADVTAEPPGLEIGAEFPSFTLPDLNGNPVSLSDFRGKQVLLLHWSPACGFCDLLAAELSRTQVRLDEHGIGLALLAYEDAEENRKLADGHGLKCPVLLYKDAAVPEPFISQGTPSAYLLDAEGRVAHPLAVGSDEISKLIGQILPTGTDRKRRAGDKPLSESRIE